MSRDETALMPLSPPALKRLKLAFLLAVAGHLPHLPPWPTALALALLAWRHYLDRRKKPLPGQGPRLAVAIAACVGVYLQFGFLMGRDPGVSALVVLAAVKLLEVRRSRDFHLMGYLCYFLTAALFLFDQGLPVLFFSLVQLVAINAAFLRLYAGSSRETRPLRGAAGLLLVSIPVAALLFILFPRLPGPLWGLGGSGGNSGVSGFTGTLEPGRVARMVESQRPVLRMKIRDGSMPPARERYFRGMVLWLTDGRIWYPGRFRERIAGSPQSGVPGVLQEITLEPHGKRWLFALDHPVQVPRGSRLVPGQVFRYHRGIERLIRYFVRSRTGGVIPENELHPDLRRMALQLPRTVDPRLKEMAEQWRATSADAGDCADKCLDFFRTGGFAYSLEPGRLDPRDPVGDFLLNRRRGFCGHYAAGFALMMRLCGVPVRIITGYQGGTVNPVDGQMVVRDSDAHAWTEIWRTGTGWVRVDPTAVVMPERLEYGGSLNASLEAINQSGEERSEALRRAMAEGLLARTWRWIRGYWDVARNYWQTWVIRYDRYRQFSLLRHLGARGIRGLGLLGLVILVLLVSSRLARYIFRCSRRRRPDPLERGWRMVEKRLARAGMVVEPWQGPLDICREARHRFPKQADQIQGVIQAYIRLRYGSTPRRGAAGEWLTQARKLHFPRRSQA